MRKALAIVLVGMAILLAGCLVRSLHPFYTARDLVFEPALVGSWEEQQDKGEAPSAKPPQVWTFKRSENTEQGEADAYDLTVSVKDHAASYSAHLAKLGDALFLDLLPGELYVPKFLSQPSESQSREEEAGDDVELLYWSHYVPVHSVLRVRLKGDRLQLSPLDDDWVAEQARKKTLGLRFEDVSGDLVDQVLTSSPKELREFLLKHAHDDKAFSSWATFKRQRAAPSEPKREQRAPAN